MRQNVLIWICKGDRGIANASFCWDGHAFSIFDRISMIIKFGEKEFKQINKAGICNAEETAAAINLLTYSGASLPDTEMALLAKHGISYDMLSFSAFLREDMNGGKIYYTEDEMKKADSCSDGNIKIHIDENWFDMRCLMNIIKMDDREQYYRLRSLISNMLDINADNIDDKEIEQLTLIATDRLAEKNVDFEHVKFEETDSLFSCLSTFYWLIDRQRHIIYSAIE